jgi:hypothetical protein
MPSSEAPLASTASRTNVRDDRETPLEWDGTKSQYSCFYFAVKCNFGKSEIDGGTNSLAGPKE